jgi:hypothetical protein
MEKTFLGKALLATVLLSGVGILLADAPTVTVDPIGTLSYASFPQVCSVTGILHHPPDTDAISELKLFINGVQEGVTQDPEEADHDEYCNFSLPWTITGPGTYVITVTAKQGRWTGEDTETVVVEQTVVVLYYPAAPAVAVHYLQDLGVKAGSPTFKNIVSSVARHMGPETDFDGVAKEDPAYEQTVEDFVDELIANPVGK